MADTSAGIERATPPGGAGTVEAGTVLRYFLSADEADAVLALARSCLARYGSADDRAFLAAARVLAARLPGTLRAHVEAARLDDRKQAVVVSGNLVDDEALGPTPPRWQEADTPGSRIYGVLLALYGALLGDAVGWATQQDGRVVADVLPTAGHETQILNSCSERELAWHTEDAFSPYRADYVGLLCLRSQERTPTTLASLDRAAAPPDVEAVLRQERFVIPPDNAHDPANAVGADAADAAAYARLDELRTDPPRVALVNGSPDAPELRIDRDFVRAVEGDPEAEAALAWLVGHLDDHLSDLPMASGDVVFIDNRNAVHGRRPFRARYDGTDRWLKRINIVGDLRRSRPVRGSAAERVLG